MPVNLPRRTVLALPFGAISLGLSAESKESAKLVLLGTGTPIPDPESSGPASAIIAGGQAYLFDAGPGVVRRAEAAAERHGLWALDAPRLTRLFLTHLHSDHTLGYPDLIFTTWTVGRMQPLEVFGPKGTADMTQNILSAWSRDIAVRTGGLEHLGERGPQVKVTEISAGEIYRDDKVTVTAIPVRHGSWPEAFGYAVNASGRRIVISGDTAPCAAIEEACHECDVLLHEVYSEARFARLGPGAKQYHSSFHSSTREVAAIAAKSKPRLLVLYHQLYFGPKEGVDLEAEVRQTYKGAVKSGRDSDVF
jgi:ribonuclease BN (tRNA processing enzyme)